MRVQKQWNPAAGIVKQNNNYEIMEITQKEIKNTVT